MKKIIFLSLLLFSCQSNKVNQIVRDELSTIEIKVNNSIEGAEFLYHLQSLLNVSDQDPKYLLEASLKNDSNILILTKEGLTREAMTYTANFKLKKFLQGSNLLSQDLLFEDTIRLHNSHSISSNPFVSYTLTGSQKEYLTKKAAEIIYHKLLIFFKKRYINNI